MNKLRNYISVLFLAVAVSGIMASMAHYHSEGLECLDHGREQHYTESLSVCPVCSLVTKVQIEDPNSFSIQLTFKEFVTLQPEPIYEFNRTVLQSSRAPPELI